MVFADGDKGFLESRNIKMPWNWKVEGVAQEMANFEGWLYNVWWGERPDRKGDQTEQGWEGSLDFIPPATGSHWRLLRGQHGTSGRANTKKVEWGGWPKERCDLPVTAFPSDSCKLFYLNSESIQPLWWHSCWSFYSPDLNEISEIILLRVLVTRFFNWPEIWQFFSVFHRIN